MKRKRENALGGSLFFIKQKVFKKISKGEF
jgi:hypothetical protein